MTLPVKRYAITGGIACGKNTVAAWLPSWGGAVLDADAVSRQLQCDGGTAVAPICQAIGTEMLTADGSVDRQRLGRLVFAQPAALATLNRIMHPLIKAAIDQWLHQPPVAGIRFQAVLIPLLFESGWEGAAWDATIAVVASEELQLARLLQRGFTQTEAMSRIRAQLSGREKSARADYTICNDSTLEALQQRAADLFQRLSEEK